MDKMLKQCLPCGCYEDAVHKIKNASFTGNDGLDYVETLVALDALKLMVGSGDDTISRKAAIDALAKHEKSKGHNYTLFVDIVSECAEVIRDLPSIHPEPCEDAVSRADVFDMLEMYPFTEYGEYESAREAVKRLPSVTPKQRWIPCGERLPEVGTYVLISKKALNFRSNLPSVCTAHRSCDPRSGKEEWNDMLFGKLDDDDVLAWMPLPESYAERRTE